MTNCPTTLNYSRTHARKRLDKAVGLMGQGVVKRIIAFALFLLGARRRDIAQYLKLPYGTLLSFLTRADKHGPEAFVDRRRSSPQPADLQPPDSHPAEAPFEIREREEKMHSTLQLGPESQALNLPRSDCLRQKIVLLSFLEDGLLCADEVAALLACSPGHARHLARKMREQGAESLIDRRRGQLVDYRFTPDIKAELIQQFAAHAVSGQSTSSRALAQAIAERLEVNLPDRSIRWQLGRLGLPRIAKTLPALVKTAKKNSAR